MSSKPLISLDYAIKFLLKNKGDYEIVEGFISAILKGVGGYPAVKIIALLESESNKESENLKKSIADVIVEDQQGHKYIVEIDRTYTSLFLHKACFNASRLIVDSIYASQDYTSIKKVFHINLIYFPYAGLKSPLCHGKTIFREIDREHPIDVHLADSKGNEVKLHNVFPEYFIISVPLFNDIVKKEMDEWLYFAKHSEVRDDFKSPYMKKVAERLSILKMTTQERIDYNKYVNESLKQRDYIVSAEQKGREEGIEKGREEGIEKGREEGREENAIAIAKKMLKEGYPMEAISKLTGLTLEKIKKLKEEIETLKEE
ncbi:Rpn family recombination-promoting nuclease/putative transposase [Candidatus Tisiphia endosymbiont of Xenochironomus xenolabis]|uniref:Rpn family recombination-promoting nuclease/putative transposase n=1 Tax=Candidatus Tisiphia endosymbiont of Xenochironomus xenolabis TaxID=3139334 RepID=UPI0035C8951B